jgi:hypothetical protein
MFHHGIGVNLADGADLHFRFGLKGAFVFILILGFSQETSDDVSNGAEPAFTLET